MRTETANAAAVKPRIDWVDYGKGICIILVVMMHSTFGVEKAMGELSWLNGFIEWAKPFRMPDFFLISGLFLASRIDRPWRAYLDTKVVHFAYFYVLWMTVWYVLKAKSYVAEMGLADTGLLYIMSFVEPLGTLWFIYMLAVFFIVAKLSRAVHPALVWGLAALLQMSALHTGWTVIDEFASRFVYFYTGYIAAPLIFQVAQWIANQRWAAVANALVIWAVANAWLVIQGYAFLPGLGLVVGFAGVVGVIAVSVLMAKSRFFEAVRYCGENSIVIYLSFFIFMAASRIVLLKLGIVTDPGVISLLVTAAAVAGPVVLFWLVRDTRLSFLFRRPEMFKLAVPGVTPAAAARIDTVVNKG